MNYRYAIIGSGRQGTAAAYDLGKFGEAEHLLMIDSDPEQARSAAGRINSLLGTDLAEAQTLDAGDVDAVATSLEEHRIDAILSGTPYFLNLGLTRAAIQAGAGMTDLGGNSQVVQDQLALDPQARAAGVAIVPDCGLGPGMTTTLALYAMEQLDDPREVFIWDCGLPQNPEPPWNYRLTFSIEGLTNEYYGDCLFIRDGKTTAVPALEELELLDFPEPIGTLEAFTTSGGLTTAADSLTGQLKTLQNKTMRYPGHFEALKVIQRLGLLEPDPVIIEGQQVSPRSVLHALWEPQIRADEDTRDLAIIRVLAKGNKAGEPAHARVDLYLYYDEETGFSAMEMGTGWHAAILTHAVASGTVPAGAVPLEKAMGGSTFVREAAKRGFDVQLTVK
ncbi:MAG: saccharopine dehydrogenase C-terminal domain-containing protein [Anaerolineales bacterium]|nr:saccharopine dehydrogenase C-terminal domain-containing protein [Anaerolineales bacterium]